MSTTAADTDPFRLTPDTGAYVPRQATEQALAELVAALRRGGTPAAIVGAAGVGKTLLLHLLAERIGPGLQSVYLPNPRLTPFELCTWVARRVGAPRGEDAEPFLRAWVAHLREQEQGCLLLVDDADAMPLATLRWLVTFAQESRGGLRLALAALTGPAAERVVHALGDARRVELGSAMSSAETAEYVDWRLARADVPHSVRARFDAPTVGELHRVAEGNPRRLNLAVESLVRGGSAAVLEDEIAEHALQQQAPPAAARAPEPAPAPEPDPEPESPLFLPEESPPSAGRPRRAGGIAGPFLVGAGVLVGLLGGMHLRVEEWPRIFTDVVSRATMQPRERAPAKAPGPADRAIPAAPAAPAQVAPSADPLRVNVNAVPWARIEVDGVDVGETPLAGLPLRPGPHTFRASLPDGRVVERTVEIDAANRHVAFEAQPPPPRTAAPSGVTEASAPATKVHVGP